MTVDKDKLKEYIKIMEYLETLYNLYYEKNIKYKLITRYLILQEYKKVYKRRYIKKIRNLEYFYRKAKKINKKIKNINIEDTSYDALIFYNKVIRIYKPETRGLIKPMVEYYDGEVYCMDCKICLKANMIKYHEKGKKHIKNKRKDKYLIINEERIMEIVKTVITEIENKKKSKEYVRR